MTTVEWWWLRAGNDGRRPSSKQFQKSTVHLVSEMLDDAGLDRDCVTYCGKHPNLWPKYTEHQLPPDGCCKRCLKKVATRDQTG